MKGNSSTSLTPQAIRNSAEQPADLLMRQFTKLFFELDSTTRTGEKVRALEAYFSAAAPQDAAWALHFLIGRKVKRAVNTRLLRDWLAHETGLPLWLIVESYDS